MSSKDHRLDRLSSSLTAKERALLLLRAWKEDKDVDPVVRWTMPQEQASEFNHYVYLMNGVNTHLGPWLIAVSQEIEKLGLRNAMLSVFLLWQIQAFELGEYITSQTKEPVSETEYAALKEQAREKLVPVSLLAYVLTEHYDGWTPEDLEKEQDAHDAVIVCAASWERMKAEKAKEIAALVTQGTLRGGGKGRALRVQAGSFYDWLGEGVPVLPDWACAYDVLPDDDPNLGYRKFAREEARKAYRSGPTRLVIHWPEVSAAVKAAVGDGPDDGQINEAVALLKERFRDGVVELARQLRAVEQVVRETWDEFGEDPLLPELRRIVDKCREEIANLHQQAEKFCGPFELEEPTDEDMVFVRRVVTKEVPEAESPGRLVVSDLV